MDINTLYSIYLKHPKVSIDTRQITAGCLFFALKGENFNGNTFAGKALELGAAYAIIDEEDHQVNDQCILVNNVLETLQGLANYHRRQLTIPFIAITGTNGKTTTKELVNSVLSEKYRTYATAGNLNNHIGVPLTLLSVSTDTEVAIIEMGANHQKEIAFLCEIAEPTAGLINNVGKAHLEGFGGFEGVKKGKGELYDYLKETGGVVFINNDNPDLLAMSRERNLQKRVTYGTAEGCFVTGEMVSNDPYLSLNWRANGKTSKINSNLTGSYNFENILAAITIGLYFDLSSGQIKNGIEKYRPTNNRSQITRTEKNLLICDYYNANPSSMAVALENFSGLKADNKVIILGDMFELGEESSLEHKVILEKATGIIAIKRIFIGSHFYAHKSLAPEDHFFKSTDEAYDFLKDEALIDSTILIKGSRSMKMESLVTLL